MYEFFIEIPLLRLVLELALFQPLETIHDHR